MTSVGHSRSVSVPTLPSAFNSIDSTQVVPTRYQTEDRPQYSAQPPIQDTTTRQASLGDQIQALRIKTPSTPPRESRAAHRLLQQQHLGTVDRPGSPLAIASNSPIESKPQLKAESPASNRQNLPDQLLADTYHSSPDSYAPSHALLEISSTSLPLEVPGSPSLLVKKMFVCSGYGDCAMAFSRSEHLARHVRKHTGERPFKCHCGRDFSRLDNLRQHAQTVHADQPELNQNMMSRLMFVHSQLSAQSSTRKRKQSNKTSSPATPTNSAPSAFPLGLPYPLMPSPLMMSPVSEYAANMSAHVRSMSEASYLNSRPPLMPTEPYLSGYPDPYYQQSAQAYGLYQSADFDGQGRPGLSAFIPRSQPSQPSSASLVPSPLPSSAALYAGHTPPAYAYPAGDQLMTTQGKVRKPKASPKTAEQMKQNIAQQGSPYFAPSVQYSGSPCPSIVTQFSAQQRDIQDSPASTFIGTPLPQSRSFSGSSEEQDSSAVPGLYYSHSTDQASSAGLPTPPTPPNRPASAQAPPSSVKGFMDDFGLSLPHHGLIEGLPDQLRIANHTSSPHLLNQAYYSPSLSRIQHQQPLALYDREDRSRQIEYMHSPRINTSSPNPGTAAQAQVQHQQQARSRAATPVYHHSPAIRQSPQLHGSPVVTSSPSYAGYAAPFPPSHPGSNKRIRQEVEGADYLDYVPASKRQMLSAT